MRHLYRTFALVTIALLTVLHIQTPVHAGNIKILGKGLYQLIPSETYGSNDVLRLKDYAHLEETVDIEAVAGASFGFEFVMDGEDPVTTVLRIKHPKLLSSTGLGYSTYDTLPVILRPGKKNFAGWNFTSEQELQPGKWIFEFDLPNSPACEFTVIPVEDLVYEGNRLKGVEEVASVPAINVPVTNNATEGNADLPYGGILTRYLVRAGIFPELAEAKKGANTVRERGYEPFIFVREKPGRSYWYYLFVKMFDSRAEAVDFATKYRQKFRRKAVAQKIQIRLAPMGQNHTEAGISGN
ncbi:SPOR domain-containing protein [Maridesulfovibrio sp.]|uniref:SPOR domain-containing protein n=1 Tax=Maridesulfovibrio sp. TaxID=2795000 RepID=UPI002A188F15|nr:SPOR domain-containing protein [Maridesulfovibrio sp.]